jgi:hypothetical protein
MTVKPDGTKLFFAWYNRRDDTVDNSLIRTYGAFATVQPDGTVTFEPDFPIATVQFPPVFTGTTMNDPGEYDPAYPPTVDWMDARCCGTFGGINKNYMGDYDSAVSDSQFVYYVWADNRNPTAGNPARPNQVDVRIIRVSWP